MIRLYFWNHPLRNCPSVTKWILNTIANMRDLVGKRDTWDGSDVNVWIDFKPRDSEWSHDPLPGIERISL